MGIPDYVKVVDYGLVGVANVVNVLLLGIMLARPQRLRDVERTLGGVLVLLAIPAGLGGILNAIAGRPWWTILLPDLLMAFLLVELILDYVLERNFRHTSLLWPYLILCYISLWGMIGYSFSVSEVFGIVTLITYFLSLLATWYSHAKVGPG